MNWKDAVVLVTGANRGLGRALVQASLDAGAKRVYAGARDPMTLQTIVEHGRGKIVPLAIDITDTASLEVAAAKATDLTMLVNNAGVLASYNVLTSTREQIAQDFGTNVFGMVQATRAFLPALERAGASGGAALVNVLSIASLASVPFLGSYSASKAAAFSITQALRAELSKKGIGVHGVLAGAIDTDMIKHFTIPKNSPDDVAKAIVTGVEQGVEDIAPDPQARDIVAMWMRDPKGLERQQGTMLG